MDCGKRWLLNYMGILKWVSELVVLANVCLWLWKGLKCLVQVYPVLLLCLPTGPIQDRRSCANIHIMTPNAGLITHALTRQRKRVRGATCHTGTAMMHWSSEVMCIIVMLWIHPIKNDTGFGKSINGTALHHLWDCLCAETIWFNVRQCSTFFIV